MARGVAVRVWGPFALFTRPEFSAERVSYDVMPPSAARGILEAIYWQPAIRWVIDRIRVRRPIRNLSVRRNEVGSKASLREALHAMRTHGTYPTLSPVEDRQQRNSILLRNVEYVIEAHFELARRSYDRGNSGKHADMARRRIGRGQCTQQPYFGTREFPAYFEPAAEHDFGPPAAGLGGRLDLGWMLHVIRHDVVATPHFFHAC